MSSLDESWLDLWRSFRGAWRCRNLEHAVALGAEIVRLAGLLRARHRRGQRRHRERIATRRTDKAPSAVGGD
jgi:hypothetical protein